MSAFSVATLSYFASHAIDPAVAERAGVTERDGELVYPYTGGQARYERVRSLKGDAKTRQPAGRPLSCWMPAGQPEQGETVLVCEGESDALAALSAIGGRASHSVAAAILNGLRVVAVPGASFPADRLACELQGVGTVILAPDGDAAGAGFADRAAAALLSAAISTARLSLSSGDLADHLAGAVNGSDWLASAIADADPIPARDEPGQAVTDAEASWPALGADDLPAFPVDALPPDVAAWVSAVAEESQTPVDLAAMTALGVLSAAAMSATVDCGGWTEDSLGLYLLVSMPSGDRKSTVLRAGLEPLRAIERERHAEAAPVVRELRAKAEVLDVRKRKLVKAAGTASDPDKRSIAEAELAEVDEQLQKIGEPEMPRLLADDLTPEAMGGLLARHGAIAVLAAESAFLDNLSGRYSDGGANLHLICAAYAGEATMIDRRNRDPEMIERPLVTIMLAVQPHVLGALIAHPIARAQGLISRFAFAIPTSQLGTRSMDPPRVPAGVHERWAQTVRHVADKTDITPKTGGSVGNVGASLNTSFKLNLSLPAIQLLRELRAEQEPRLAHTGDLRPVADWIGRHAGRVARIAALLHLAESAEGEIGASTMLAALAIGDYLLAHGVAALTGPDEKVRRSLQWLSARARSTVSLRELHRGPLGARGSTEDALALAEGLTQYGALRPIPAVHSGPGRPPSPTYEIHPHLLRQADRTDKTPRTDTLDPAELARIAAKFGADTNGAEHGQAVPQ